MEQDVLRKLQLTELQILLDIDRFCSLHEIRYSLYSGTALGAVRHGGFIPWDDDVDLVMVRPEYDRFCAMWESCGPAGYTLENIETDKRCEVNHTKIRKNNTLLLSNGESDDGRPHGIWVDLFAWDKIDTRKLRRLPFRYQTAKLFFLTRANGSHKHEGAGRKLGRFVFRIVPPELRQKGQRSAMKWIRKHNEVLQDNYQWTSTSSFGGLKLRMEPDFPFRLTRISFENTQLPIFEDYDTYLKAGYGDYMRLPPADEQVCKHNPTKLCFADDVENGAG